VDAHVKVSGVWKSLNGMHTKVGGVWKEVSAGYIKVSGVWKQFYTNVVVTLSGHSIVTTGTGQSSAYAGIRFNTDGTVDEFESHGAGVYSQIDSATDWIIPNAAVSEATYHVRVSAAPPTDDFTTKPVANGSWIEISANREWGVEDFDASIENSVATGSVTFEISDDAGSTVLTSAAYSLSANWRGA